MPSNEWKVNQHRWWGYPHFDSLHWLSKIRQGQWLRHSWAEQSLPTPDDPGSNPVKGIFCIELFTVKCCSGQNKVKEARHSWSIN